MKWLFTGDRPIYAQLVEQIQLKILAGEFPPGEKLPSIRDLAAEAAVNPNTMQKAFSELEQIGLVYTQRTSGRYVTDDVEKIAGIRGEYAKKSVIQFISEMKELGYSTEEIIDFVAMIIKEESK